MKSALRWSRAVAIAAAVGLASTGVASAAQTGSGDAAMPKASSPAQRPGAVAGPGTFESGEAAAFAIATDGSVMAWQLPGTWVDLGGDATQVYGSLLMPIATFAGNRGIFRYVSGGTWERIGGPGAQFAEANGTVYGLSPDRSHVYQWNANWNGPSTSWTAVGGPASAIFGGEVGLVATNPSDTGAYLYAANQFPPPTHAAWQHIGGGGAQFAQNSTTIFGLTPNRTGVYQWSGHGTAWTRVGGAAQQLYTEGAESGALTLAASSPGNLGLYGNEGSPGTWIRLGGPGAQFVIDGGALFDLKSVGGSLYQGTMPGEGSGSCCSSWYIGGPFLGIAS